jgi:hypothetical protein
MKFVTAVTIAAIFFITGSVYAAPVLKVVPHTSMRTVGVMLINESTFGVADDDTDFLFRLGMLEGHLMIGHDLLQHNQPALALPHFGHPVRELYDDIADYLKKKNFASFDTQLAQLEVDVASKPNAPETEAKFQEVVATVHKARELAPEALRSSLPEMIKVCSDTIDAASGEYNESMEHGQIHVIIEYHDSKGYLQYVQQQINDLMATHKDAQAQDLLKRFKIVLAKAEWIVQPLLPSPSPRASVGQYRAVAAEAAELGKSSDDGKPANLAKPSSL